MNISYPPKESCEIVWPKFVEWMAQKMDADAFGAHTDTSPLYNLTFRGLGFHHCPFCGRPLNPSIPIMNRHL